MKISGFNIKYTIFFSICLIISLMMAARAYPVGKFKLKPGAEGRICLKCHKAFQKTIKSRSVHPLAKTGKCSACHEPHTSSHKNLLAAKPADLCFNCHEDLLPEDA